MGDADEPKRSHKKVFHRDPFKIDVTLKSMGFCDACTKWLKKMGYTHQVIWNILVLERSPSWAYEDTRIT